MNIENCHMYENELPEEGDLVVVKILNVQDNGAQCSLLEYGDIEGMLPCTEYSRKRIKSIKKIVRPGKQDVLLVTRVDKEKKYIDLSKKHVSKQEREDASSKFRKSSFVHSMLKHLVSSEPCKCSNIQLSDLYEQVAWPMYKDFEHAFNGFEQAAQNFSIMSKYTMHDNVRSLLKKSLEHKFALKPKTVSTTIEVSCVGSDGINAIKQGLAAGKEIDLPEDLQLNINVVRCPDYCISAKGVNTDQITAIIQTSRDAIQKKIQSFNGGIYAIKQDIKIV